MVPALLTSQPPLLPNTSPAVGVIVTLSRPAKMFSRTLLALASLALTAQAQQQIRSPDNNLWTCPDTQTIEVAYASYCAYSPPFALRRAHVTGRELVDTLYR